MTHGASGAIAFHPDTRGHLELRVTALTGEQPLTPLPPDGLLTESAAPDPRLRRILEFLSYREKLLAGSWQYDTYFGRDTLMSLALLGPVAEPALVEAGLGSVLERLNEAGEVAHEEAIGEFALLGRGSTLDYKMVDDDFMLAAVAARLLLQPGADRARVASFLARGSGKDGRAGDDLVRNLRFVVSAAAPFADAPGWERLVSLKPGERVGNWRDSNLGLGGGRYPYDVNGVLVPAALQAAAALRESGFLRPYLDEAADAELARAAAMAETWLRDAPPLFDVVLDGDAAKAEVAAYADRIGVDAADALAALAGGGARFRALALDAEGKPIAVQNSDEAMALFFLSPPGPEAARIADTLTRPFPAGLLTGAGLVVANPAYAPEPLQPAFDRNHYHGAVIWSWQQALLAAGIERQLARSDLAPAERRLLEAAGSRIRTAIATARELRGSELWSWVVQDGAWRAVPFGTQEGHETESNAAQLWSAVHLALP
jgi:glycogen debranching enzyme